MMLRFITWLLSARMSRVLLNGDFHAVDISTTNVARGTTTVASKGSTTTDDEWIVSVDLTGNNPAQNAHVLALRVTRDDHGITAAVVMLMRGRQVIH